MVTSDQWKSSFEGHFNVWRSMVISRSKGHFISMKVVWRSIVKWSLQIMKVNQWRSFVGQWSNGHFRSMKVIWRSFQCLKVNGHLKVKGSLQVIWRSMFEGQWSFEGQRVTSGHLKVNGHCHCNDHVKGQGSLQGQMVTSDQWRSMVKWSLQIMKVMCRSFQCLKLKGHFKVNGQWRSFVGQWSNGHFRSMKVIWRSFQCLKVKGHFKVNGSLQINEGHFKVISMFEGQGSLHGQRVTSDQWRSFEGHLKVSGHCNDHVKGQGSLQGQMVKWRSFEGQGSFQSHRVTSKVKGDAL